MVRIVNGEIVPEDAPARRDAPSTGPGSSAPPRAQVRSDPPGRRVPRLVHARRSAGPETPALGERSGIPTARTISPPPRAQNREVPRHRTRGERAEGPSWTSRVSLDWPWASPMDTPPEERLMGALPWVTVLGVPVRPAVLALAAAAVALLGGLRGAVAAAMLFVYSAMQPPPEFGSSPGARPRERGPPRDGATFGGGGAGAAGGGPRGGDSRFPGQARKLS